MKWIAAALFALALLMALGFEAWALQKRAEELCLSARALARHAGPLSDWLEQAARDPFLGEGALGGPVGEVRREFQQRSRRISTEYNARLFPEESQLAYRRLSLLPPSSREFVSALRALPAANRRLRCEPREASTPEEKGLAANVEAGALFWAERRALAKVQKKDFEADRLIYCHTEELLRGLRFVAAAAAERCRSAPARTKLAQACGAGSGAATSAIGDEISDLEKQKEFNSGKLRKKWPAGVLEGLRC